MEPITDLQLSDGKLKLLPLKSYDSNLGAFWDGGKNSGNTLQTMAPRMG